MLYQPPLPPRYAGYTPEELRSRIAERKRKFGPRLVILGHHYQQDEVIEFADFVGDSFKLSQLAAAQQEAEYVIFCGVHFMAESADILTDDRVKVILPDLSAGCSMADMAGIEQVEEAWDWLTSVTDATIVPITYVNSSAAVKGFVGGHGGACCTSSNARAVLEWALAGQTPCGSDLGHGGVGHGAVSDGRVGVGPNAAGGDSVTRGNPGNKKIIFLPDQHLGRNTAYDMGWPLESMLVYDPKQPQGGLTAEQVRAATIFLWKGHCSVHQLFTAKQVDDIRAADPAYKVIVHPECDWSVVQKADLAGSTEFILKTIDAAPAGSKWAVGTEVHLVHRLAKRYEGVKSVRLLAGIQCLCTTMYRIDLKHLLFALDELAVGRVTNLIRVDPETRALARLALDRMLSLVGSGSAKTVAAID